MNSKGNVLSVNVEKGERIIPQKSLEQRVEQLEEKQAEIETFINTMKGNKAKK